MPDQQDYGLAKIPNIEWTEGKDAPEGKQVAIDQQGGDPRQRSTRQDDIAVLREGGQTNYGATYADDADPFDDDAKLRQEHYAVQPQRYPVNQFIGTRIITGRWDVPFISDPRCEIVTPLLPDPLTGYGRKSIMLYNNSTVTVYIGMDQSVSVSRDFPLLAGGVFVISKDASSGIWMISTSPTVADIRYIYEMGYIGGLEGRTS